MVVQRNRQGIHLFKGTKNGEFYWHTRAKNGRITANGEGYKSKGGALDGIAATAKLMGAKGPFEYYDHTRQRTRHDVIPLKKYLL